MAQQTFNIQKEPYCLQVPSKGNEMGYSIRCAASIPNYDLVDRYADTVCDRMHRVNSRVTADVGSGHGEFLCTTGRPEEWWGELTADWFAVPKG